MKVLFVGQVPKDSAYPEDIEDALSISDECNRIAVSDGAGESFDPKTWAGLLVRGYINQPQFEREWVQSRIKEYTAKFDGALLSWSQQAALERGSFATLLCAQMNPEAKSVDILAIGDSIAVLCDGTDFVDSFPLSRSEQFNQRPELISTRVALNVGLESPYFIFRAVRNWNTKGMVNPILLLMTDALGQWALRLAEQDCPPWEELAGITEVSMLQAMVAREREAKKMRTDDVTLINISLTETNSDGVPVS
jgi:hypothetical protein